MNKFSPLTQLKREAAIAEYFTTYDTIQLQKRLEHKNIQTTFRLLERHQKHKQPFFLLQHKQPR